MMGSLEQWAHTHQYSIQAVTAFATVAAVLVSLGIALLSARSNRTNLSAVLDVKVVVGGGFNSQNAPRYIAAGITNKGASAARIEFAFFSWKIPFESQYWTVSPLDFFEGGDPVIPRRTYPIEIPPRAYHSAFLSDIPTFKAGIKKAADGLRWGRRWRMELIKAYAITADGQRFRVKLSPKVAQHLAEAIRS